MYCLAQCILVKSMHCHAFPGHDWITGIAGKVQAWLHSNAMQYCNRNLLSKPYPGSYKNIEFKMRVTRTWK